MARKRIERPASYLLTPTDLSRGPVLLLLSALCMALICGCANQKVPDFHLNAGIAYLESKQYASAMKELKEAEKLHPNDPAVHYYQGILFQIRGLTPEAVKEFKKAISLKSDYSDAYNYLGLIEDSAGHYDEAIANFRKAASNVMYETPSYALNNMGWSYYKKGDYDASAAAFKEAIRLDLNVLNRATFETNIGRALQAKGDQDGAVTHFNAALKLMPDAVEPRFWLGKSYQVQNKREAALKEFQAVVTKSPDSDMALKAKEAIRALGPAEPKPLNEIKPPTSENKESEPVLFVSKIRKETAPEQPAKNKQKKKKKKSKQPTDPSVGTGIQ